MLRRDRLGNDDPDLCLKKKQRKLQGSIDTLASSLSGHQGRFATGWLHVPQTPAGIDWATHKATWVWPQKPFAVVLSKKRGIDTYQLETPLVTDHFGTLAIVCKTVKTHKKLPINKKTREWTPKAKVLRRRHCHALRKGVACQWGMAHQWGGGGVSVGMSCQCGGGIYIHGGCLWSLLWGGEAKVSSSLNYSLLQHHFAPFCKGSEVTLRKENTLSSQKNQTCGTGNFLPRTAFTRMDRDDAFLL